MKLVLHCSSSNSDDNSRCSAALVDLTPELAVIALHRIEQIQRLKREDHQIYEIYYWGWFAEYFDVYELDFERTPYDQEQYAGLSQLATGDIPMTFVPDSFEPELRRTECNQMIAVENGVQFYTIPKHTSTMITTEVIDIDTLRRAAGLDEAQAA